jgi:hypothetical protein
MQMILAQLTFNTHERIILLMKQLLVVVPVTAALLGVTWGVYQQDQATKTNKLLLTSFTEQQQASDLQQAKTTAAAQVKKYQDAYTGQRVECQKGQTAYALLTPLQKTKTPQPQCGPANL